MSGTNYSSIAAEVGLTELRVKDPALTGAGVTVGQVEAYASGTGTFEVMPSAVGQPATNSNDFLTYYSGPLQTNTYNDGVIGSASTHATTVAELFYGDVLYGGEPEGVAPGVAHVDNYNANNYAPAGTDKVVNLSFTSSANADATYDAAALTYNVVFVAAAGDGGTPASPSTAYNVISVGSSDSGANTAIGPASDGAAKPDVSAPGGATSFSAPLVSGAATLLVQAGTDGYGGTSPAAETAAVDFRTIKALLLNGAVKPAGYFTDAYAPTSTDPLNGLYGSGILNVYNSLVELQGGEQAPSFTGSASIEAPAFVASQDTPVASSLGWDLDTVAAAVGKDATTDTLVTLNAGSAFVSTLTWAASATNAIDNFSLTLFNESTGLAVAQSDATLSNVQQVYFVAPQTGVYDLQVQLTGSSSASVSQTYALAYDDTVSPACFCGGTKIAIAGGEIAVEALEIGFAVITASGELRPVRWIGHRQYGGRFLAGRPEIQPVRFYAGCLGDGLPRRDLLVSPEHAMFIDGLLIPARCLVNGTSIVQERGLDQVTYFHVELDTHDVLLAEGAPSETFYDDDSRGVFHNAATFAVLYPDAQPGEGYCAPRVEDGPALEAIRRRIARVWEKLAA